MLCYQKRNTNGLYTYFLIPNLHKNKDYADQNYGEPPVPLSARQRWRSLLIGGLGQGVGKLFT